MTEQELEDKYGSLKRDVGQDEEGMFFIEIDESDSSEGSVTAELRKVRIEDADYQELLELNLI